jgi:two-component system chemotaxis sensor kinase CheA
MSDYQDAFRQSFREEAGEIVVELEAALLALSETPNDSDLVGRVFRALHTIKGSGAMFGFDELATFTHELENAFDNVRGGALSVTPEMVEISLLALDQIRNMLQSKSDPAACATILSRTRKLTARPENGPLTTGSTVTPPATLDSPGEEAEWRIRFVPGPDMMRNGSDPLLLLKEVGGLGKLTVNASMAAIPPLGELEPERCYVSWEMTLSTRAGEDAIRDVFIFVEDSCELSIDPIVTAAASEAECAADITATSMARERTPKGGRRAYDKPDMASSLRVPAIKLDKLVDLVGELVTVQARLTELAVQRDDPDVSAVAEEVERLASALRENSINMRMLPIRATFERFRRLVHDLANDLGKNVELTIDGADTELDKTVIEQLGDPLMHLIRNSMDHGIESPAMRTAQGKPPMARIQLSARHAGASVLISVFDDGRGIDREAVHKRAIERGLTTADASLTESEIFDFIFQPNFSTAHRVTDLSGRGVGMDVVRKQVDMLRGSIDVVSKRGSGTTVTLRLPLTLAIIDGLLVKVADGSYVLPLANTLECIELTAKQTEESGSKHVVNVRGAVVPYIRLREYLNLPSAWPPIEQIMLVETEEGRFGLVVDQVLGNCQTVIKSLGRCFRGVQIVSGATILGNGTVALIVDAQRLVQEAIRSSTNSIRARSPTLPPDANSRLNCRAASH